MIDLRKTRGEDEVEREGKSLEYKEKVSRSFLKTVSAFANWGTGRIVFGVNDNAEAVGLEDPERACLDIENAINDNISPVPEYALSVNGKDRTVTLTIHAGGDTPYMYQGKAYRRSDSATAPVEQIAMKRLILRGNNQNYEDMPSGEEKLEFHTLEERLVSRLGITALDMDVLKTLGLCDREGRFNCAAELLADRNSFPGTDMVRFGNTANQLMDRRSFQNISIISQYELSLEVYRTYYQFEEIRGMSRASVEMIPEEAFREAMANALIHRTWDVSASVQVAMYGDRIDITSPGGLPEGLSEEEYLRSRVSVLRNPKIAEVFLKLNYIEKFGTGIFRINESYRKSSVRPGYSVMENSIRITLPVIPAADALNEQESRIIGALASGRAMSRRELEESTGLARATLLRAIGRMVERRILTKSGSGRGTHYRLSQAFPAAGGKYRE